jgi:L-fucose isomerase
MVATENDALNGATMLLQHLLTGSAQMFSDVRTYWSPEAVERVAGRRPTGPAANGFLHLINSGPSPLDWTGARASSSQGSDQYGRVPAWWDMTPEDAAACLEHTLWCPSDTGYFPAGGWSTDFTTVGGLACTMSRINLVKGLGPVLQIAEGETVSLPPEVHDALDHRTSPTWPTTWFVPRLTDSGPFRDVYSVMAHWGANHGAISYGHIGADLISLAAMLRIPVDMHNVAETSIFRPAVWDRFGSLEPQGGDYRACANYGPLYE